MVVAKHCLCTIHDDVGVTAAHYGIGCGGEHNYFLKVNPESFDVAHPIDVSEFSFDGDKERLIISDGNQ